MPEDTVTWTATLYSYAVWVWLGWLTMGTPVGLMLLAWGFYGRRGPTGVPTCPECGQDMRGIQQLQCPTCNYQPYTEGEWFKPRRRRNALWLATLFLLPWLYPLFGLTMQGWDRLFYYRASWPNDAISLSPQALPLVLERSPAWIHPMWNRITVIHLATEMPDDEAFPNITYLTALRVLRVDAGQRLTDASLEALEDKASLTDVELHATNITDKGVKFLESETRLTNLSLPGAEVTGSSLQYLRELPIRQLNLAKNKISSGGLRHVGSLTELTHLNLAAGNFPDNALPHLRSLPNLQVLILDGTPLTNAALPELARHKQLQTLSLIGTKITPDAATQLFDHMPALQQIKFKGKTLQRPAPKPDAEAEATD